MSKKHIMFFLTGWLTVVLAVGQPVSVRTLHYTTREGMASNVVNTLMQDRQGYLWLGTNLGLTRFDGYRFVNFYREEAGTRRMENVTDIVEDTLRNRLLVRGTDYEIYPFDLSRFSFAETDTTLPPLFYEMCPTYANEPATVHHAWDRGVECKNPSIRHNSFYYVTLANGNEVWATVDNGFYIFDAQSRRTDHFTSSDEHRVIDSDMMSNVLFDGSGAVWMSNVVTGLYQLLFADGDVRYHRLAESSETNSVNSVRSFSELKDGRVLVSNMMGDVFVYDLKSRHAELLVHKEQRVYATLTDRLGRLWLATRNGGLWVDDRHLNSSDGLKASIIFHLVETDDGTVWIATLDDGVIAAKEKQDGGFSFKSYLTEEKVHQQAIDKKGMLWVATESGVFVGGKGAFRRVYEGSKVVGICCTDDDRVLAATIGNGLLVIDKEQQSWLTTADGLANDCVKAVAWDEHIGIVAATDAGITVIAPDGETRNIYSSGGMTADIFNESAALRLSDGRILLGSLDGFVEVKSEKLKVKSEKLGLPLITSIAVNDVPRYEQHFTSLTLPHDQNHLSITFSCLDYKHQPSIIYTYQLEGLDNAWRPSTKESMALYNNLSPGHYRFRVRAARAGQPWGEETVCDIVIRQPWRWTWWARSAYILAILLFIWYEWRHYKERQRLRRQLDQRLTALYATSSNETVSHAKIETTEETASQTDADAATKAADKAFLDRIDSVILPNLLKADLDMAFLADKMCMSHSTLYRRIKVLTGMTANEYVRKHRLAKAMQLLRDGVPVTEVSMQCGFNSPSYFTRCFKAEYGLTPSEV